MTAIAIDRPGGPEVLHEVTRNIPAPGARDVCIKVHAAGINRPDIFQREGLYPPPPGASDLPGLEVAGVVDAVGVAVTRYRPGDHVCALSPGGGYAEYCVAPASQTLPVPDGLSMIQAAALPETFFTVWYNLFELAKLQKDELLLIHGGSSGIGTTAIQLAKALGSRVAITAGTDEKCQTCEDLGAELAINYNKEDFVKAIKEHTDADGVNVILDIVGASYFQKNLDILAEDGRLVIISFLGGRKGEFNLAPIQAKRLTVTGSQLRPLAVDIKAQIAAKLEEKVWPLLASEAIRPIIDDTYSLHDVAEAHRHLESGKHIGKVVLEVQH